MTTEESIYKRNPENRERGPLGGRTILVTGGTSGTGQAIAEAAHKQGADIVVMTRSFDNFSKTSALLGDEGVYPLILDLKRPNEISEQLDIVEQQGVMITDIVHAAAGGMESFLGDTLRGLHKLGKEEDPVKRATGFMELQKGMEGKVRMSIPDSHAVNFTGATRLYGEVADRLPHGGKMIYYPSFWSHMWGQGKVEIPAFYEGIAQTKRQFENWITYTTPHLTESGAYTTNIVSGIISDTGVGKTLDRFLVPLLPEAEQAAVRSTYVTRSDVARATLQTLLEPTQGREHYPQTKYVFGPGGVISHKAPPTDNPIYKMRLPL